MPLPLRTSFVQITGPCAGAGKSTLAQGLLETLTADGIAVWLVPEAWIFEWAKFAWLARMFRTRNFPSAAELRGAFDELDRIAPRGALWLQDWSWIDLGEDLPWAVADVHELERYSHELMQLVRPRSPLVLYLSLPPIVGIERAALQRGDGWAKKPLEEMRKDCDEREPRLVAAIEAGGWPIHRLDATRSPDAVLDEALLALTS
jgi:hypothetical protein